MTAYATYPSLGGRGVLITGGASGIGSDLVRHFCAQGARVGLLDQDANRAAVLTDELRASSNPPAFRRCDLTDLPATLAAVDILAASIGPISILINNAGDDARHDVAKVSPEFWDRQLNVNLRHHFFLAQWMVAQLPVAAAGSIVNLGSIAWMKGARDMIVYATAKSAIVGMTKAMSREFGRSGVRANSIAPGWVATDKQMERAEREQPGAFAAAVAAQAIPKTLMPADISRLALWLAADDSALCTGQTIIVDGGVI